jgi:hypothetical protein
MRRSDRSSLHWWPSRFGTRRSRRGSDRHHPRSCPRQPTPQPCPGALTPGQSGSPRTALARRCKAGRQREPLRSAVSSVHPQRRPHLLTGRDLDAHGRVATAAPRVEEICGQNIRRNKEAVTTGWHAGQPELTAIPRRCAKHAGNFTLASVSGRYRQHRRARNRVVRGVRNASRDLTRSRS